ncbi:MAG TPA: amine oxidase, partial [Pantoea sp.]|nr:amine oxidase [Pantoea sp.]
MTPFSSFWQAGYEGADHINPAGVALSMNDLNQHQARAAEDYAALGPFAIRTVRESVGWRLCERDGRYDFSTVAARIQAAEQQGIQLSWTICHYGWPAGVSLFDHDFVPRFAAFCGALARFLAPWYQQAPIYSPMNEISFVSWGISVGLFACEAIPEPARADAAKQQLVRATLAGCDAIWQADPRARVLHCDPLIHIAPDPADSDSDRLAREMCDTQYQAWDMLSGRRNPELGGAPRYLDLIGVNYYHDNQWEQGSNRRLYWHLGDRRRQPLHQLLLQVWQRYQRPLLLAETSHVGSGRGAWIREIATQVAQAQLAGADLLGICLYPIL